MQPTAARRLCRKPNTIEPPPPRILSKSSPGPSSPDTNEGIPFEATTSGPKFKVLRRPKLPRGHAPSPAPDGDTPGACSDSVVDLVRERTAHVANSDGDSDIDLSRRRHKFDGGASRTLRERERLYEEAKRRIWTEQNHPSLEQRPREGQTTGLYTFAEERPPCTQMKYDLRLDKGESCEQRARIRQLEHHGPSINWSGASQIIRVQQGQFIAQRAVLTGADGLGVCTHPACNAETVEQHWELMPLPPNAPPPLQDDFLFPPLKGRQHSNG